MNLTSLIFLMMAITPHSAKAVEYLNWRNAKMDPGMVLLGNVFSTLYGIRSRLECQKFCIENSECKSYNLDQISMICQLNNVGKTDANHVNFQKNSNYVYADFYDVDACMTRECCLDTSTNKNKDNFCYTQIELEKDDSLSTSSDIVIRVRLTSGKGDHINITCSDGVGSLITDDVDFSQDVFVSCSDVPASSALTANVSVSYFGMPPATAGITIMSKGSPVTVEEVFTDSNTAIASWSLPKGELTDVFFVSCSDGIATVLSQNSSSGSAMCQELLPSSSVVITVTSSLNFVPGEPSSLTMYLEPDIVEFVSETTSLVSVAVDWLVMTGTATEFVGNCSIGYPESSIVIAVDGAGSLNCSGLSPLVEVDITVTSIENGKEGSPVAIRLSTDDFLDVILAEDTLSSTDTMIAVKILSTTPHGSVFNATCSAGLTEFHLINGTYNVICSELHPGHKVYIHVEVMYADQNVGSGGITLTTVPATVLLFEMTDVLELSLDVGEAFAIATFNLTSGEADSFAITCSDGVSYQGTLYYSNLALCAVFSEAEVIEITVEARRGDKIGNPTTINASVIRTGRESYYTTVEADEMWTEDAITLLTSEVTNQVRTTNFSEDPELRILEPDDSMISEETYTLVTSEITNTVHTNFSGDIDKELPIEPDFMTSEESHTLVTSEITNTTKVEANLELIEEVLNNMTAVAATLLSNSPESSIFTVTCSAGNGIGLFDIVESTAWCFGLDPGQSVTLTVMAHYGNQAIGSTEIELATVPDVVTIYEKTDVSEFQFLLDNGPPFAVAEFYPTSGVADMFIITCSGGTPYPGSLYYTDPRIAMCALLSDEILEVIDITVRAESGGKTGEPATITASVILGNQFDERWSAE